MTGIIGMATIGGTIIVILASINNKLIEVVQNLDIKNHQLNEINKRLEKELNEKQKLQAGIERAQKMELIGTIAGGVAHDLNNVLVSSIIYPEMLLMQTPDDSPFRKSLETIKKSGMKAAAIVNDLLTLTRRGVSDTEVININNIVSECLSSPEFEKIKKYHPGLDFEVRLKEDLWNIVGAPFHLMKTITNLVSNAAEAMLDGGKITIETQNLQIKKSITAYEGINPGDYVVLTVSDEGTGIPKEEQEKIFEPFYTKKVMGRSGTGLGMTVVYNTVKDHKGHIKMDSIEGIGTVFSLYFPMTERQLKQSESEFPVSEYAGEGEAILVVDDIEEQREIASEILSMLG